MTTTATIIAVVALIGAAIGGGMLLTRGEESVPESTVPAPADDSISIVRAITTSGEQVPNPDMLVHFTLEDDDPAQASFRFSLITVRGDTIPPDRVSDVRVSVTDMLNGDRDDQPALESTANGWQIAKTTIASRGWWRITIALKDATGRDRTVPIYLLMPDPNMSGQDAVAVPAPDPSAGALLDASIANMADWTSTHWSEWLSGGNDSIVLGDFRVTTQAANGQPDAFQSTLHLSGLYDATLPSPKVDAAGSSTVSIGDTSWTTTGDGVTTEDAPVQYLPIREYPSTYEGRTDASFGIRDTIGGTDYQVVSFILPNRVNGFNTWFLFWIDPDSQQVARLAMITRSHYMTWTYSDVNEPFVITPPNAGATPDASPTPHPSHRLMRDHDRIQP